MHIIKEQLRRVNNFLIILIPLFIVNALFNLKYDWGGVSVIARIYIMVLSFYVVFIFSQINSKNYESEYTARFGWKGKYYLFFILKIFPFVFIYLLTIVFTLINYINTPEWPLEPVYRLLDGRYSNTIIYALILFLVLKKKKRPGISIPFFIICSILYFTADKVLYSLFDPGTGVSVIKITKYFIFFFVLIYGYSQSRWKLIESVFLSLFSAAFLFTAVASFFIMSFFMSPQGSSSLSISGEILLKSGFVFPLNKLKKIIPEKGTQQDSKNIFRMIEKYGQDTGYTDLEWEKLIQKNRIENNEYIFNHLNKRNIKLNFEILKNYITSQFLIPPPDTNNLPQFTKYFGSYYSDNKIDFYELYNSGSEPMKIAILKSLAYTNDIDAVNFLIDKLTSVDRLRAEAAYNSLKKISGKDPADDLKKENYDIDVILFFRDYASKMKK